MSSPGNCLLADPIKGTVTAANPDKRAQKCGGWGGVGRGVGATPVKPDVCFRENYLEQGKRQVALI